MAWSYVNQPAEQRFRDKLWVTESGCWRWTGAQDRGAPFFHADRRKVVASRWAFNRYRDTGGTVTRTLANECGTPLCVNPWHYQPVVRKRPVRTRTHCIRRHPLLPSNLAESWVKGQAPACVECRRWVSWKRRAANSPTPIEPYVPITEPDDEKDIR